MDDTKKDVVRSDQSGVDVIAVNNDDVVVDDGDDQAGVVVDDDDSDDYDENAVIEESPDSRWQRRNSKVFENDLSGCDCCCSYLAVDSEEGVEVVWNEVIIPVEDGNSLLIESHIHAIFSGLIRLEHPNIVKLHAFWTELPPPSSSSESPAKATAAPDTIRLIFITEHADTGSLRQFLKNTKKTDSNISKACWRRWSVQIVCALNYLHCSNPPVVHGMLSSQTIFIQSDGVLKVGVVSPKLVHLHMIGSQFGRNPSKDTFYSAPEYFRLNKSSSGVGTPADIYAFGIIALEMLTSDLSVAKSPSNLSEKSLSKLCLSDEYDAVEKACVQGSMESPKRILVVQHPAVFESYSLKILAAHSLLQGANEKDSDANSPMSELIHSSSSTFNVVLNVTEDDDESVDCLIGTDHRPHSKRRMFNKKDLSQCEDPPGELNDFLADIRHGQYPPIPWPSSMQSTSMYPIRGNAPNYRFREFSRYSSIRRSRSLDLIRIDHERILGNSIAPPPKLKSCLVENDRQNQSLVRVHLFFDAQTTASNICEVIASVQRSAGPSYNLTAELINRGIIDPADALILNDRLRTSSF